MVLILLESTLTPSLDTIWPKYSTSSTPKKHLEVFSYNYFSSNSLSTMSTCKKWSFQVLVVDQYIIRKSKLKFSKKGFENGIHQILKCGRCISNSKSHEKKFIMTLMSSECCFQNVFSLHSNLMILRMKIQLYFSM